MNDLIKKMIQASKGAARAKYIRTSASLRFKLFILSCTGKNTRALLKANLMCIPLYLITGKGEHFYKS